jgi:hypothetical protein
VTGTIEGAIRKVFNFAKALRDTMVDAGHWADDLMNDATKYGMDVEDLQRWQNAADFIDTDVETIISARDRLSRKMSEGWTKGTGDEKKDMWELLGIDLHDGETGQMRDQMDVMFELGETLRSMVAIDGNDVRASELAMEVFGKSYRELLPLFQAGQEEWNRTVAEQRVVSKEHVEALGAMDDANNQLENSWETLKYTALSEIAPVMTDAANALSGLLNEFNDWMETEEGQEAMQGLAESLRELFGGLGDIKFKDAIETAKNGINDLRKALEWIQEHKSDVENALKIIAGGFALLKVSELATNIGKIVSGFQTLWSGANRPLPSVPGTGGAAAAGSGATGAAGGGFGAAVGKFFTSPAAKAGGAALAFISTLFKNTFNPQGNDDILDEYGQLTGDALKAGYYLDENGNVQNQRAQAQTWQTVPAQPREEIVEDEDLDPIYTLEQKLDAAQDWWDAYRNADNGTDSYEEADSAFEHLQEVLGEGFGDFWDAFLEKSDSTDMSKMQDLPQSITDTISQNADKLDEAVSQMRANTDSGKTVADKVAGADFKRFNSLPAELATAVQRGAASGMSGIIVRLDGQPVGRLVAPYVNAYLGSSLP